MKPFARIFRVATPPRFCEQQVLNGCTTNKRPLYQRITTNLILFAGAQRIVPLKKFRSSRSQIYYKIGVIRSFVKYPGKHLRCRVPFLMQLSRRKACNALKNYFSSGVSLQLFRKFKNTSLTSGRLLLKIIKFQGKDLCQGPIPVTLRELPCDFIKTGFYHEQLVTKEYSDFVTGQIFNKRILDGCS